MPDPRVLFEDGALRVAFLEGSGGESPGRDGAGGGHGNMLLAFTGIGHGLGGIEVQHPEFLRAREGFDGVFFITDLRRSWGNALDFGRIAQVIGEQAPGCHCDAIGNSMGGFLAMLAPSLLPVRRVVAFAPQFSVHPAVVPWETRWANYRARIRNWVYPSLENTSRPETVYHVFAAAGGPDGRHARMLPKGPNVIQTRLPHGHGIAKAVKDAGLLQETIARCFAGSYDPAWLVGAMGAGRPA